MHTFVHYNSQYSQLALASIKTLLQFYMNKCVNQQQCRWHYVLQQNKNKNSNIP